MIDAANVIGIATQGIVKELAQDYEVSLARMYEMLGDQCTYPKSKKLIRAIAHRNQPGVRLIKADLDALFVDVLQEIEEPSLEEIHREAFEAVDSILCDKPPATQRLELLELLTICQRKLEGIERKLQPNIRRVR